ncbi:MAG: helix-turn-helix domain-containing protein [bacterium]|nr:helix-turn-helix domain-containing protein [bacterium]
METAITDKRATIMTVKEVAKYLRLHETSIYRMCKNNTIPCYKVGNGWRFKKPEIEKWFYEQVGEKGLIEE